MQQNNDSKELICVASVGAMKLIYFNDDKTIKD